MKEALIMLLAGMPLTWRVFLLSMIPITELRAAIPLGIAWGMDPLECFFWCVLGNMLPVLPVLLFFRWAFSKLIDRPWLGKALRFIARHSEGKEAQVKRYGIPGLIILVAIPLPLTGVWSGALVAALLRFPVLPATVAIIIGELIAGVLVSLAVSGVIAIFDFTHGPYILAGIILVLIALWIFIKKYKKKK